MEYQADVCVDVAYNISTTAEERLDRAPDGRMHIGVAGGHRKGRDVMAWSDTKEGVCSSMDGRL